MPTSIPSESESSSCPAKTIVTVVGTRISEKAFARLLAVSIPMLRRWERTGQIPIRHCNHKRIRYLEDAANFLRKRGLTLPGI